MGAFSEGRPLYERLIGPNQWYVTCAASLHVGSLTALQHISGPFPPPLPAPIFFPPCQPPLEGDRLASRSLDMRSPCSAD